MSDKIITASEARAMIPTTIELICRMIATRAKENNNYLCLYTMHFDCDFDPYFLKILPYTDSDIKDLEKLRYNVVVTDHNIRTKTTGHLWWKKVITTKVEDFHTIYW